MLKRRFKTEPDTLNATLTIVSSIHQTCNVQYPLENQTLLKVQNQTLLKVGKKRFNCKNCYLLMELPLTELIKCFLKLFLKELAFYLIV